MTVVINGNSVNTSHMIVSW